MNYRKLINLFHIIFVGSLFLYVGIKRENIYNPLYNILFYLGIFIIIYHLYKVYVYLSQGKKIWINLIHICIIGPLLVYIGYYQTNTSRKYYELLLMLAFASIGYHGYYLMYE